MFEDFYGFKKTPFSRDIPTNQLYQSHRFEETLGRLGIRRGAPAIYSRNRGLWDRKDHNYSKV
jgi:hypothetical protein